MMVKTRTKGTMVVNQESEEICGISWGQGAGVRGDQASPRPTLPLPAGAKLTDPRGRTCPRPSWLPSQGRAAWGGPVCLPEPPSTHLQDEEEEEIGVGHFLELLEEVDRQEGDDVVLGGLDAVALGPDGGEKGVHELLRPRDPPASLWGQGCTSLCP